MTSAVYLEHYLDSLEHLPIELQRNFTLMRDLDTRAQTVMRQIDSTADEFMINVKSMPTDKKKEVMTEIQQQFNKAKEYGDDKVQLAIQTYELVDKHIRRLDSDLSRFEMEIQDKAVTSTRQDESGGTVTKRGRKKAKDKEKKKRGNSSEEDSGAKSAKKKKKTGGKGDKSVSDKAPPSAVSPLPASPVPMLPGLIAPGEVLDMPVDPNEPTYCLCHQVSYGEMIGCDNPDCPIEWFHFACVSLTTKPKGKWFCPKCSADRKRK